MRRSVFVILAAALLPGAPAQARELDNVTVAGIKGPASVFFDYEEAVWHAAPMSEKRVHGSWRPIRPKDGDLVAENGALLVVRDHLPYYDDKGRLIPLE